MFTKVTLNTTLGKFNKDCNYLLDEDSFCNSWEGRVSAKNSFGLNADDTIYTAFSGAGFLLCTMTTQ